MYRTADQIANFLCLDISARSELLIAAPKLMQAFFAAAMDYFTYMLASNMYGYKSRPAYAALALTMLSPWQAFCSVRTLSNSIETTLTVFALFLWPWDWFISPPGPARNRSKQKAFTSLRQRSLSLYQSLALAALACILRPTNIILWATVSVTLLIRCGNTSKLVSLAQAALLSGGAILAISVSADRMFYQDWILPPLRFLQFNLVQSLAVFYGRNRPDYYLTEGLPLLLTTALPFAVIGTWQALLGKSVAPTTEESRGRSIRFTLATAVLTTVLTLSLISHKEVRFIYPLLPILHILAAQPLASFFAPFPLPRTYLKRTLLLVLICINAFIAWYTLFVHQRGVVDVLHFLRDRHEATIPTPDDLPHISLPYIRTGSGIDITTVGFLMPCHSTPWRSHLVHPGIHAWALTCEPPLNLTMAERTTYMDEADVFYEAPASWLANKMGDGSPNLRAWPEYLVFFEQLEESVSSILSGVGYAECWRALNTHWHDDSRRHGDVIVWRRDPKLLYLASKAATHKSLYSPSSQVHGS